MKLIFLDFDGVLNTPQSNRQGFDLWPPAVELLAFLMRKTGARVVFSTAWREYHTEDELKRYVRANGLGDEADDATLFAGVTPVLEQGTRGHEIQAFLDANPGVDRYVIFDDAEEFLPEQSPYLIRTDTRKGLKPFHLAKAQQILEASG